MIHLNERISRCRAVRNAGIKPGDMVRIEDQNDEMLLVVEYFPTGGDLGRGSIRVTDGELQQLVDLDEVVEIHSVPIV